MDRASVTRKGIRLAYFTIAYNLAEALISLGAGLSAGSVALVGFGIDSGIEVTSAVAARWRLGRDGDEAGRERSDLLAHRVIGWCFVLLSVYVAADSIDSLLRHEEPDSSIVGVCVLIASVIVMPALAGAKRKIAMALKSGALVSEARQTSLCAYLSSIALVGVGANALAGWWWADPAAALAMVPIIGLEGWEGIRAGHASGQWQPVDRVP
jgi:divalent metal cation (Fe/Co/Zn/Cd) transporter